MKTENVIQSATPSSFGEFYDEHKDWAIRFVWLMVRETAPAEDITHDAFIKVYERFGSLTNPSGYLRTTLTNAVFERSRQSGRENRRIRLVAASQPTQLEHLPAGVMDAISRLPIKQRTAIVFRYWVDLPVDEIAEAMSTRPGTVKSWLSRANAQLRKELEQ